MSKIKALTFVLEGGDRLVISADIPYRVVRFPISAHGQPLENEIQQWGRFAADLRSAESQATAHPGSLHHIVEYLRSKGLGEVATAIENGEHQPKVEQSEGG